MLKESATALSLALLYLLVQRNANGQTDFGSVHDTRKIAHFDSVQAITNHFSKANVPIKPVKLELFRESNFIFAAYPYSGVDTIDVYVYVKYGDEWVLQMLYFHPRPKSRQIRAKETKSQIVILCGDDEILRLTPDPKLNAPDR